MRISSFVLAQRVEDQFVLMNESDGTEIVLDSEAALSLYEAVGYLYGSELRKVGYEPFS